MRYVFSTMLSRSLSASPLSLLSDNPSCARNTNPNAMRMISHDTIYTNVALLPDGDVWWEGKTEEPPAHAIDWHGNDWTPDEDHPAAHPNARFTVPAAQAPSSQAGKQPSIGSSEICGRRSRSSESASSSSASHSFAWRSSNPVPEASETLEVGSATESVTVSAETSLLKTESSDVSVNVTGDRLVNLGVHPEGPRP